MIIAGDVGGTNTRLAVFDVVAGISTGPKIEKKYKSNDAESLVELVFHFMNEFGLDIAAIKAASFAVAGPVINQRVNVTNLLWDEIDSKVIAEALNRIPVFLMNDLVGLSNFVPILEKQDVVILNEGVPSVTGAKAVIAPGTGLGEGFLINHEGEYEPFPSEGGHADFAPIDEQQLGLLSFLMPKYGHVSYERVCSGIGVPDLYEYIKLTNKFEEPEWLANELNALEHPVPAIFNAAVERGVPLCVETVNLFCRLLGAEAGNLALKILASGGVYVGGGIPPRIIPFLKEHFMSGFLYKGRFSEVLKNYPVSIITHPNPVLFGAARKALSIVE